jgi:hypothetical protein
MTSVLTAALGQPACSQQGEAGEHAHLEKVLEGLATPGAAVETVEGSLWRVSRLARGIDWGGRDEPDLEGHAR